MEIVGHVLIDERGKFLSVNDAFSQLIGESSQNIIGRSVEELTAPPDREECAIAITRLRQTGRDFSISKRFIRTDGSLVWVTNNVSLAKASNLGQLLIASIVPVADPSQYRSPARLMRCAKFIVSERQQLSDAFGQGLAADPGLDILLLAYIAEGEGASLLSRDIMQATGQSHSHITRWIVLLLESGLVEIEGLDEATGLQFHTDLPLRLSAGAHTKLENALAKLAIQYRELIQA